MKQALAIVALTLALTGCVDNLQPLDYKAQRQYVPISLELPQPLLRDGTEANAQTIAALKATGAFSFLGGGFSRNGYSLQIKQYNGGVHTWEGFVGVLTLFTLPLPYHYHSMLTGDLYKDGDLLKHYSYVREGTSVMAWYVPSVETENERQMLGDLLVGMERDKLVPYGR
jgi:hypothetical protein